MQATTPHPPDDARYIHTEGINYQETGSDSIWGGEDDITVQAMEATSIQGRWLNVCAGDGRFNARLLEQADQVVAFDIDQGALQKLQDITPENLRKKLLLETGNVTERFPFENESFDGVFCTGTLHLFPEEILRGITAEIDRVLRAGGLIILDYATDIKRALPDSTLYVVPDEANLTLEEGIQLLQSCFAGYTTQVVSSVVPPEQITETKRSYTFSSTFFVLSGTKPQP